MSSLALQCLKALPGLEWLNLDGRPLDLSTLDALSGSLTRLTYLSLDDCYGAGCAFQSSPRSVWVTRCRSSINADAHVNINIPKRRMPIRHLLKYGEN